MLYVDAVERAAMLADRTGKPAYVVGWCDDWVVIGNEPKAIAGRTLYEILPRRGSVVLLGGA